MRSKNEENEKRGRGGNIGTGDLSGRHVRDPGTGVIEMTIGRQGEGGVQGEVNLDRGEDGGDVRNPRRWHRDNLQKVVAKITRAVVPVIGPLLIGLLFVVSAIQIANLFSSNTSSAVAVVGMALLFLNAYVHLIKGSR